MKFKYALAVLILCLAAQPVSAQDWQVYDTFKGPIINPALWGSGQGACQNALECERLIQGGNLWLRIRGYNRTASSDGEVWSQNGVDVEQPTAITGILARLVFTQAEGTFCPGIGSMVGQMGLRATIFHSHPNGGPSANEWLDEVEANLHMYPQPNGTINVGGLLRRMGTADAAWSDQLGVVKVGEVVDIWLRWDEATRMVYFGMQPLRQPPVEMEVPYSGLFPDAVPSTNPYRVVRLQSSPHNCSGVQLFSDVEVRVDRVSVLR